MTEKQVQAIYDDGYIKGRDDQVARFRIGTIYANKQQIRTLQATQALVSKNEKHSLDYRQGYADAINTYVGVIEYSNDVDKTAIRSTVEEQARIIRNRIEQRYREAVQHGTLDHQSYSQITACIEAVYMEFFTAGVNVGLGELIGPQKITLLKKE